MKRRSLLFLILLLGLALPQTARAVNTELPVDAFAVFSDGTPLNGTFPTTLCLLINGGPSCAVTRTLDLEYAGGVMHTTIPMEDLIPGGLPESIHLEITISLPMGDETLEPLELHPVPSAIWALSLPDGATVGSIVHRGFGGEIINLKGEWVGPQIVGAKGEQGPAGPPGPTGPQGATGAQGTPTTVNTGASLTGGGSGTVINLDVVDGGITSAKIADGTITTADIHADAAITDAQIKNNLTISAGTVDDSVIGGTTPNAGTFTTLLAKTSLAFEDPTAGVKKVTIDAPDNLAGDYALQLPPNVGTANQVLQTDGLLGALVWATVDVTAGDDAPLAGTYITVSNDATLTTERALAAGTGITLTDGGANSTMTVGVSAGGVSTTEILNGTIVDADISGTAAMAHSKLAALTSGNILVGSAGNVATSVGMTGDVAISNAGVTTIGANAVALTTDTTGNYVAGITPGTEITVSGAAGEGWSPTVGVTANGLDFSEFEDALDLDASTSIATGYANTLSVTSTLSQPRTTNVFEVVQADNSFTSASGTSLASFSQLDTNSDSNVVKITQGGSQGPALTVTYSGLTQSTQADSNARAIYATNATQANVGAITLTAKQTTSLNSGIGIAGEFIAGDGATSAATASYRGVTAKADGDASGGTVTNYGVYAESTGVPAGGTVNNYGVFATVSGGSNNYAAALMGGKVGIGTATPGQTLSLEGTLGILEGGASPSFHTIFQGGDQTADVTYTLPTAAPGTSGQVLSATTAGVMSWKTMVGAWTGHCMGSCTNSTRFIGPFRSTTSGTFRNVTCSWNTNGADGTTNVVVAVVDESSSTEIGNCTLGLCNAGVGVPLSCDLGSTATFASGKNYTLRLKSTTNCVTQPGDIICNVEINQ